MDIPKILKEFMYIRLGLPGKTVTRNRTETFFPFFFAADFLGFAPLIFKCLVDGETSTIILHSLPIFHLFRSLFFSKVATNDENFLS